MATTERRVHSKERVKRSVVTEVIGGKTYEVPEVEVCSGIPIKTVYRPEDIADLDYERDLADPGSFPYTRGVQATMYRTHLWTFRNYAGFGTGAEARERFLKLLASGQLGLSVAFDLPTQLGLDSDNPKAQFEVGRVGVAIDSLADFEEMYEGIDIGEISSSYTINATANIMFAMLLALANKRGVAWERIRGTIQNDCLKEFVARGNFIFPPAGSITMTADALEFAMAQAPKFNAVSVSASHVKEAGANNAFAHAVCLRNGLAYIDEMIRRGHSIDKFGPNISFNLFGDMEFFENIAQQRASRRLWAHLLRDRYGATIPKAMQLRYLAGAGSGTSLTHAYPLLNIARLAFHCLMQVLGGTQAVGLQSYDEAYEIPSEEAAELSLLIQAVVAYELGVTDVADPLGGSYLLETLTNQMEEKIKGYMDMIDGWGGPVAAIESGQMQLEIARQSYKWQRRVEDGSQPVVGVNIFKPVDSEKVEPIRTFKADPTVLPRQLAKLKAVKAQRNAVAVGESLQQLDRAARAGENTMPYMVSCVGSYATVGEITDVLVKVYGRFEEPGF